MFLSIVSMWGQSIESADHYTQGHCERVADRACALASAVGFDGGTLLWFRMGALLHDVGKIVVPPEILNKPGPLTPEERAVMERHPEAGVELIDDLEFPWDVRPMVRHHHEAWDGSGYPAHLAGEEIPFPRASSAWPTSTTRSPPTAPTAPRSRTRKRCGSCRPIRGTSSTPPSFPSFARSARAASSARRPPASERREDLTRRTRNEKRVAGEIAFLRGSSFLRGSA